jgi:thioester reductase-like protein
MKAFVIGATGFLGGYLVADMIGQGACVSNLARST